MMRFDSKTNQVMPVEEEVVVVKKRPWPRCEKRDLWPKVYSILVQTAIQSTSKICCF